MLKDLKGLDCAAWMLLTRGVKFSVVLLLPIVCWSCKSQNGDHASVRHESSEVLTPDDLGIKKESFIARPKADEVAIFRVEKLDRLKPEMSMIYDQIFWRSELDDVVVDVVIAPLSFYVGKPESDSEDPETFFRDSWSLSAGMYRIDVEDYSFVGSSFGSGHEWIKIKGMGLEAGTESAFAKGDLSFTKHSMTKSKDLEFKFRMFIISLEDAKKMHPELDIERSENETGWSAAYMLDLGSSVLGDEPERP